MKKQAKRGRRKESVGGKKKRGAGIRCVGKGYDDAPIPVRGKRKEERKGSPPRAEKC